MEAVSGIIAERMREPPGLRRMIGYSLALHALAAVALMVVSLLHPWVAAEQPTPIMTVSLAGGPGPRAGGLNPLGGRPVQTTVPPASPRPEPIRPPAAKTPEMTLPVRAARPTTKAPATAPPVKVAPDEARGSTPARGDVEQFGSAIAETGAQGFGGLSTGGGSGTRGLIDEGDFCCPQYLALMQQQIQANWNSRQEVAGSTMIKFRIQRDGTISDMEVERPSGFYALDYAAQRALVATRRLPPLPPAFPGSTLTVHLMFDYVR